MRIIQKTMYILKRILGKLLILIKSFHNVEQPKVSSHIIALRVGGVENWIKAQKEYLYLKEKFRRQGEYKAEDEMHYLAKKCEARTKGFFGKIFYTIIYKHLLGYGVKLRPVFGLIVFVVLYSAIIFFYATFKGGLHFDFNEIPNDKINVMMWDKMMCNSLYLSFITYSTVGYGEITPIMGYKAISMIEGLLGVFLNAWLVVVLFRRIIR